MQKISNESVLHANIILVKTSWAFGELTFMLLNITFKFACHHQWE